jgi:ABC-type glycerol-3-phosphate transport system substrate-binding protein
MAEGQVGRRDFLKVVAGTVGGLIVGGVAGYVARAPPAPETVTVTQTVPTTVTQTVTTTVAETVTPTPTVTVAGKRFEGLSISYVSMSGPPADGVRVMAPLIKEKYGIDIEVVDFPWEVHFSKLTTEFVAGEVSYDIAWLDTVMMPSFVELDILQPIDDLVERDRAELPPLDQFAPVHVDYATYEGKTYGWFYSMNFNNFWVRKDLFEDPKEQEAFEKQYGYPLTDFVKQPDWVKFNDVIEFFHRPPDLYGYTQPLVWPQLVFPAWHTRWFTCTGKPELDENWDPWFDRMGDLGIMSIELIKYQMKFMPPGVLTMDNPDALAVYLEGKAAVMTGWDTFVMFKLNDPSVSKVVGKTLHLPPIGGPKGHAVYTNIGHLIGITTAVKDEEKREAAWAVIKEVTKPENEVFRTLESGQSPATKRGWELLLQEEPDLPIQYISQYLDKSMGVAYGPFFGDILVAYKDHVAAAVAGEKDTEKALQDLARDFEKAYEPYIERGIKNTHGLTIPAWEGPDYTEELKKQIGM